VPQATDGVVLCTYAIVVGTMRALYDHVTVKLIRAKWPHDLMGTFSCMLISEDCTVLELFQLTTSFD
jgi:hypothetical protein